jgi:hypothetical protein
VRKWQFVEKREEQCSETVMLLPFDVVFIMIRIILKPNALSTSLLVMSVAQIPLKFQRIMALKNMIIQNRHISFTLNLTKNCSWCALRYNKIIAGLFCLHVLYQPSSSSSIPRLRNKQFPSLATIGTDNVSIIIYFPTVLFPKMSLVPPVTVLYNNRT